MDNITHALIGAAVAEGALAFGAARGLDHSQTRAARVVLQTVSILANNLPDADLLLTWLTPGTLGYMLQHRGYTHIFLAAAPLAVFLVLAVRLLQVNRRIARLPGRVWLWAFGLALAGGILHVAADSMNSYGVHPLWPFSGRWFYGDAVFIIEPLLWITLGGFVALRVRSRFVRIGLPVLVLCAYAFGHRVEMVGALALCAAAMVVGLLFLGRGLTRKQDARMFASWTAGLAAVLIGSFFVASHKASERVRDVLAPQGSRVFDVVMEASPSNPFCWSFLTVEQADERYLTRAGRVSLLPEVVPLSSCPRRKKDFPLVETAQVDGAMGFTLDGEFSRPIAEIRALVAGDCQLQAWARFVRVPVFEGNVASDLRYVRGGGGFSSAVFGPAASASIPCPARVPSWGFPRGDVFGL